MHDTCILCSSEKVRLFVSMTSGNSDESITISRRLSYSWIHSNLDARTCAISSSQNGIDVKGQINPNLDFPFFGSNVFIKYKRNIL